MRGNRLGKGRKSGSENRTTVDVRALKQHILDSWNVVDGDRLLARLAKRDPFGYLKLVCSLLPRQDAAVTTPFVIPTVSEWGLVVLALCLAVCGKVYFGRRAA